MEWSEKLTGLYISPLLKASTDNSFSAPKRHQKQTNKTNTLKMIYSQRPY